MIEITILHKIDVLDILHGTHITCNHFNQYRNHVKVDNFFRIITILHLGIDSYPHKHVLVNLDR